jgi:NADPH-dependent 2,4-dienoyl-CoA reductase/sulfur reductase-like enzyme/nitrite reductase/ring-hydroxylating ferredoxin subunit
MATKQERPKGPDLAQGIPFTSLRDGGLLEGHVGGEPVLLARQGDAVFAVGAKCPHYGAPLVDGIVVGDTVRCPWHHACFSLRTGEALRAPAFDRLDRWQVRRRGDFVFVGRKLEPARAMPTHTSHGDRPRRIVIIGAGAAGFAAAEMLRRRGFDGGLTMISSEDAPPYDRPNLSKDYLAGEAPEDWLPLKGPDFYAENRIDLKLRTTISRIGVGDRLVGAENGETYPFDRLLIATGAEPVRLSIPGADQPHVLTLRSLADSRAIIERTKGARTAVVLGASFIGLEVAAALRARGIEVHVVAPDDWPLARVLGPEVGSFIQSLHERHGVKFHLREVAARIAGGKVVLKGGIALDADFVVAGIGVKPRTELAEYSGIKIDRGVVVDEYLETSVPNIFAAGDIARWPDARTGASMRVEHWVVAQRQGQTAAVNMLGMREPFSAVPFFWSRHYDVSVHYVGHAESWDAITVDGNIAAGDCIVRYSRAGQHLAVASMGRDKAILRCEADLELSADECAGAPAPFLVNAE